MTTPEILKQIAGALEAAAKKILTAEDYEATATSNKISTLQQVTPLTDLMRSNGEMNTTTLEMTAFKVISNLKDQQVRKGKRLKMPVPMAPMAGPPSLAVAAPPGRIYLAWDNRKLRDEICIHFDFED